MDNDLGRIKGNVEKMVSMGAPESDIDAYIAEEGVTIDAVRNYQPQQITPAQAAVLGLGQGLFMGFGDEVAAAGQSLMGLGSYEGILAQQREYIKQAKEQEGGAYLGSEIAGSIAVPMGAAKAIPALAKGGKVLTNYAARGLPQALGVSGATGAAAGGLYGAGTSEEGQRLAGAAEGAGYGTIGGIIGAGAAAAAQKLAAPLGRLSQKALNAIAKKRQLQGTKMPENLMQKGAVVAGGADEQALAKMSKSQDDIFAKTKGQRTQMPEAQRLEADAMAGLYGDEAEKAARTANILQSRERKDFISKLGDIDATGNANDAVESALDVISKQSKSLKGQVNSAYDLAREGGGTQIAINDIKDGLFARIAQTKRDNAYDINQMPQVKARVQDLKRLMRSKEGVTFTNANLNALENFRKRVSNGIASTQDKTEKRFLGQMLSEYDDFMYKTANNAIDVNDANAIKAFRDAVRLRREYGKLYESDKFVKDIVEGRKGVDDAVKDLIGTGSIVGKKRMENTYDALISAAGKEKDLVQKDLQTAFAKKILQQSTQGLEAGSAETAYLSAAKMQNSLEGLFVNNEKFATKLYGVNAVTAAKKAIDELEPIARSQAATGNPSGSGQLVLRKLAERTPFINLINESFEMAGQAAKTEAAKKSFAELVQEMPLPPRSNLFKQAGAFAGGAQAGDMSNGTN